MIWLWALILFAPIFSMDHIVNSDDNGNGFITPVHKAIYKEILKKSGGKPRASDSKKMKVFKYSFFDNDDHFDFTVEHALIKDGFDINQPIDKKNNTMLHCALSLPCWNTKYEARFRFLLEHNADLDTQNYVGKTPFDNALSMSFNPTLPLWSACGYQYFPVSVHLEENPLQLLEYNARLYKELIAKDSAQGVRATNTLANLFIFIQNNENNRLQNHQKPRSFNVGMSMREDGYCLKHMTFVELIDLVGKKGIRFVMQDLNLLCEDASGFEQDKDCLDIFEDTKKHYPFVTLYRERNALELLKNGAQLFKKVVACDDDNARIVKNIMAQFFNAIKAMEKEGKFSLLYCLKKIKSFARLEQLVGKEGIAYVIENIQDTHISLLSWKDTKLCEYFRDCSDIREKNILQERLLGLQSSIEFWRNLASASLKHSDHEDLPGMSKVE
jgi:hypothetical protein